MMGKSGPQGRISPDAQKVARPAPSEKWPQFTRDLELLSKDAAGGENNPGIWSIHSPAAFGARRYARNLRARARVNTPPPKGGGFLLTDSSPVPGKAR